MNFTKILERSKNLRVTIVKIAIAFLVIFFLLDKLAINNFYKIFQNINTLSIETLFHELVGIGKFISLEHSICIGLGFMVCQLMLVSSILCIFAIYKSINHLFVEKVLSFYKENKSLDIANTSEEKIYLQINKFIC